MTTRNPRDQFLREWRAALMARLAQRAMTTRETGLDGLAKRLLQRGSSEAPVDPELDHPADWDRPVE